jgi:hypothetical protein
MDRRKAGVGRVREETRREERRGEERRRDETRRGEKREDQRKIRRKSEEDQKKMQVCEKVEKSRNTVFFQCFVALGGSKSRLAKAAGAEPCAQMR